MGRERRSLQLKLAAATIVSPFAAAAIWNLIAAAVSMISRDGDGTIYRFDSGIATVSALTLVSGVIACICNLAFGLPVYFLLKQRRKNSILTYLIASSLAGLIIGLVAHLLTGWTEWYFWTVPIATLSTMIAWLIRRPDRNVREEDRAPPGAHGSGDYGG
jgi:hypothetical protein